MRHRWISLKVLRFALRRTGIVLALATVLIFSSSLVAQQQSPGRPPSQSSQDAAIPYSQPPQDNLPPLPSEPVPSSPSSVVPPSQNVVVPPSLTIPAGTFVTVRLMGSLSSDINQPGDGFSATLEQPIVVDGWVVARRGQIAVGRVVALQKAGRVKGVSSLGVILSDLPLVDGRQLPVQSQLVQTSAGTSKGRDAVAVASTTGMGAAIGGAVDGGTGAGIGAAAGAAAGVAGVLLTPGKPTVMPPETLLTFRLQEPITISTERSSVAYQPVNQQDYASAAQPLQQRPVAPAYPAGPVYSYPSPYPYVAWPYWGGWGFYPTVSFIGYYGGGYGWGHGGHWH
jgi:hypothetical protein